MGTTQHYCCVMLPTFGQDGLLPPGIHWAEWPAVVVRFGASPHRRWLLEGLEAALRELGRVGCRAAYLDGSFVTAKAFPGDYDLCWEPDQVDLANLDKVFFDVYPPRAAQRAKYRGDLLPNVREGDSGELFVEFFQRDKETGRPKGIVALDPRRVP
jgi:Family of unknown function (DUF6932)